MTSKSKTIAIKIVQCWKNVVTLFML